jgi:hypothetical protein
VQAVEKLTPHPEDPDKILDPPEDLPMVFIGMVGIKDPLRKESRESVLTCQRAGVIVRMVTGEEPESKPGDRPCCNLVPRAQATTLTRPLTSRASAAFSSTITRAA